MTDVLDILDSQSLLVSNPKKKRDDSRNSLSSSTKKPEKLKRELLALLQNDGKDSPPIMPISSAVGGYKQQRVQFARQKRVRPWQWVAFNPGREDSFLLNHWRRVADQGKEYPFANFNRQLAMPKYTQSEYQSKLQCSEWTKDETDHLLELCSRFDLRFPIILDRWDKQRHRVRSMEDLKKRYYDVCNAMASESKAPVVFDAEHEKKRKEQLSRLYNRTAEQVEEEQRLLEELRKIEQRKKERERKTQDLQKLITAADNQAAIERKKQDQGSKAGARPSLGRGRKKVGNVAKAGSESAKNAQSNSNATANLIESAGIKFPEAKAAGASLRSQRMKLPSTVGQKKSKAIEQLLIELSVDLKPMPTEEICTHFNELRSDMVLLYELKMALANSEFELQTLKHQLEALQSPGVTSESSTFGGTANNKDSNNVQASGSSANSTSNLSLPEGSPTKRGGISEVIDIGQTPNNPIRKRKAALEQGILMKKLKKG